MHLLAIGDFGTTGKEQLEVAAAMQRYISERGIEPQHLLLLGDNFYSNDKAGFSVESELWKKTFEDVYPSAAFPGPCHAVLGNHDYHNNPGGEKVQLAYSAKQRSRFTIPAKWYRLDLGSPTPLLTVIALDSNLPSVSGGKKNDKSCLTESEANEQQAWLEAQLAGERAPLTLVIAHHPIYSNGDHGDTSGLHKAGWGDLFEKHRVHAYLCGHDHDLQHLELEGLSTSFVLSGGGGANTRKLEQTKRSIPFGQDVYGFTHLQVSPDRLIFSHHDRATAQLHRFTKHADGRVEIG
jgi:3',5'-cyclic AMP phosphodiesterase CpdA